MSVILNEVFANFEEFEKEQKALDKAEIDNSQFNLLRAEAELTNRPATFLDGSILITADNKDVLLEKKEPFGSEIKDVIEEAHPETVILADGPERSGVVDNLNEQQRKILNMVNKQPTGNTFNNFSFASEIKELISIADELDTKGLYVEADALTHVVGQLGKKKR